MKIVILDGYALNPGDLSWEGFVRLGDITVYEQTSPEDVAPRIGDAEIAIVNKIRMHKGIFDACDKLRYVGELATGYNNIDLEAASAHGVCVTNVPAYSTDSVAQMTFALLLELCHRCGHHSEAVHAGKWSQSRSFCFWDYPLVELSGGVLGIIGYGSIGRRVAQIAKSFGMRVLACTSRTQGQSTADGVTFAPMERVLAGADVLSLHCPLTPATEGMINRETLALMKDGALLVNTARGQLLVESDVRDALVSGKLGGAAVDVVSVEPIRPDNPLLGAPNCIITPHIAWAPLAARQRLMDTAVRNLAAFLAGNEINRVNAKP